MGLDMYLEKKPKVDGYTFDELKTMHNAMYYGTIYGNIQSLLSLRGTKPAKELAEQFEMSYYTNESEESFWKRMEEFQAVPENQAHFARLGDMTEAEKELTESFRQEGEELAYWRKTNHVHRWFVENVQGGQDDCERYEVTRAQLTELLGLCTQVLGDKEKAEELLPTTSGFFFGGTDYDEYYYSDLRDTLRQLSKAISDTDFEKEIVFYQSSW